MLKDIFSDDNYRFCGQNDIGVNRIVGWHKDKLNNKYASYESTDIWAPYMGAKNIILVGHDGGSINGEANFKGYHTSETMDQKNTDEYKAWLREISEHTVTLKGLLKVNMVAMLFLLILN